ncbi:MAG: putative transcriptional regulator [Candidatus Methanohalarchaeum thermophilum]|uniref:Transcriptional regulator n=1 Tax=Methanohalarchaeum thermophilum TaxID=1903181 RepID=A0A1Q6DVX8_METT1|nr:MAG: putative transcriptional regulator [Candidatus Methanohalarchaeum thermophilum]
MIESIREEVELFERHLRILELADREGPIGMGKISDELDIPKHKVRYSLRILENEGLIKPSSEGAMIQKDKTDEIKEKIQEQIDKLMELRELI